MKPSFALKNKKEQNISTKIKGILMSLKDIKC